MIKVITTKNNSPLSIFIRFATKEPASHFAIVFDDRLAFHSNLYGAHPIFKSKLIKHATIIEELHIPATLDQEEAVFVLIENKFDGKPYDYLGLLFWFIKAIPKLIKGQPVHNIKENPWNTENQYMCTEIANALSPIITNVGQFDLSTLTPTALMQYLKEYVKSK